MSNHGATNYTRAYESRDMQSWVRCRTLGFLATSYFDDVVTAKPVYEVPAIELVAEIDGVIAGVLDVTIDGELATIETIAVHPDYVRRGLGTAMLVAALDRLEPTLEIDAWTREDQPAGGWYEANGFVETFRYLHVFAADDEITRAVTATQPSLTPVLGFFHADIDEEASLRRAFRRVHVCRRFARPVRQ